MKRYTDKLVVSFLGVLLGLGLEAPVYAGFNFGKQGKGVLIFNLLVVLAIVGIGAWVWWKKHNSEDGE